MRQLNGVYQSGGQTLKGIGDYFGLHYSTVSGIIKSQKPDPWIRPHGFCVLGSGMKSSVFPAAKLDTLTSSVPNYFSQAFAVAVIAATAGFEILRWVEMA